MQSNKFAHYKVNLFIFTRIFLSYQQKFVSGMRFMISQTEIFLNSKNIHIQIAAWRGLVSPDTISLTPVS